MEFALRIGAPHMAAFFVFAEIYFAWLAAERAKFEKRISSGGNALKLHSAHLACNCLYPSLRGRQINYLPKGVVKK